MWVGGYAGFFLEEGERMKPWEPSFVQSSGCLRRESQRGIGRVRPVGPECAHGPAQTAVPWPYLYMSGMRCCCRHVLPKSQTCPSSMLTTCTKKPNNQPAPAYQSGPWWKSSCAQSRCSWPMVHSRGPVLLTLAVMHIHRIQTPSLGPPRCMARSQSGLEFSPDHLSFHPTLCLARCGLP